MEVNLHVIFPETKQSANGSVYLCYHINEISFEQRMETIYSEWLSQFCHAIALAKDRPERELQNLTSAMPIQCSSSWATAQVAQLNCEDHSQ